MLKRVEIGIAGKEATHNSLLWIKELALDLQLKGAVFFKHDGSIKIMAEGQEENLSKFIDGLETGSIFALVENFYVDWIVSEKPLDDFHILDH